MGGHDDGDRWAMTGYGSERDAYLKRLRRIEGQIRGLQRMVEQAERGQRQRGHVVREGPEQVALDRGERAPGQPDCVGRHAQVTAHQRQVARLDRRVGAGAHATGVVFQNRRVDA